MACVCSRGPINIADNETVNMEIPWLKRMDSNMQSKKSK